ncbi:MAG: GyrI-like domain-containing protein [Verrucomicrobia bacterium]|nr:GyrI-like domain-containing protein [Verrucomicrobiota bacterium]
MSTRVASDQGSQPRFEPGRALLLAGLDGTFAETDTIGIPALWQTFLPQIHRVTDRISNVAYGVISQAASPDSMDYFCGVEVSSLIGLPETFTSRMLPARKYIVFTLNTGVEHLAEEIGRIWHERLPELGFTAARAPFFELYPAEFHPETNPSGIEIWIPLN